LKAKTAKKAEHLKDLKPDKKNPRLHPERNISMLEKSLEQFGAARSIVVDEHMNVIAGNGLIEAAANVGIVKVRTVEANGNEIIAVVRRGLTKAQKRGLSVADNRTAELAEWDPEVLKALSKEVDLGTFWTEEELKKLIGDSSPAAQGEQGKIDLKVKIVCPKCGAKFERPS
jgi:hypothetical protein